MKKWLFWVMRLPWDDEFEQFNHELKKTLAEIQELEEVDDDSECRLLVTDFVIHASEYSISSDFVDDSFDY